LLTVPVTEGPANGAARRIVSDPASSTPKKY
jgi:hypothetical protein